MGRHVAQYLRWAAASVPVVQHHLADSTLGATGYGAGATSYGADLLGPKTQFVLVKIYL